MRGLVLEGKGCVMVVVLGAITSIATAPWARGQVETATVTVPGNASGYFGSNSGGGNTSPVVPLIPAVSVSGPSTITIKYLSGYVTDCCGYDQVGPEGFSYDATGAQTPLQEASAFSGGTVPNLDALMGTFVSQARLNRSDFKPVDGAKAIAPAAIAADLLFFIGEGKTIQTPGAGTLYLGINDWYVGDNGGEFVVQVKATPPPFNPSTQFSVTKNPNGVWSYGWEQSRGSALNLYTQTVSVNSVIGWTTPSRVDGGVFNNPTDAPITIGTVTTPAMSAAFSPGPQNQNAVFRWTAPFSGQYAVSAKFYGVDYVGPTTSDVSILHNDTQLFAAYVNGYGPSSNQSYTGTVSISKGDTLDFTCGYGDNGNYYYDTTGLVVTITQVE